MADTNHSALTGTELHEPKGVAAATDGQVATASGGAVTWSSTLEPTTLELATSVTADIYPQYIKHASVGPVERTVLTAFDMDAFAPSSDQSIYLFYTLPTDIDTSGDVFPRVEWLPEAAGSENVEWTFDVYSGATLASDISDSTTSAAGGALVKTGADGPTLTGTLAAGQSVVVKLTREGTDTNDTYASYALFGGCVLKYKRNKLGA